MTKENKSPAERAIDIAADNSLDDDQAIRQLLAIMITVQEDTVCALFEIQDALGFDKVKH